MRGEQVWGYRRRSGAAGPSPRARGAVVQWGSSSRFSGTIPACAGSRFSRGRESPRARDHPRVRGEQNELQRREFQPMGPSPHARGAEPKLLVNPRFRGTIPACAGSSTHRPRCPSTAGDHPRVRGEQCLRVTVPGGSLGPSPRARGAAAESAAAINCGGTIPACAGSRRARCPGRGPSWDHPRVRGEQELRPYLANFRRGPSPRARGAGQGANGAGCDLGTIPACAGSSFPSHGAHSGHWDHPRVRGEQRRAHRSTAHKGGPSPRARGAATNPQAGHAAPGTIPACAGSRCPPPTRTGPAGDHPRVRGEQITMWA